MNSVRRVAGLSLGGHRQLVRGCRIKTDTPIRRVHSMSKAIGCLFYAPRNSCVRSMCVPSSSQTALYISSRIKYGVGYGFYVAKGRKCAADLATTRVLGRVCSIPRQSALAGIIFVNVNRPFSGLSRILHTLRVLATSCNCG